MMDRQGCKGVSYDGGLHYTAQDYSALRQITLYCTNFEYTLQNTTTYRTKIFTGLNYVSPN